METLFSDNIYIILFCFLLGLEGSFGGAENRKYAVFYLFIGALAATHIVRTWTILFLLCVGLFTLCEILTADTDKAILLHNVLSKIIDTIVRSALCYHALPIALAVVINSNVVLAQSVTILKYYDLPFEWCGVSLQVIAAIIFLYGVNKTISEDFQPADCKQFLNVFLSENLYTSFDLSHDLAERLEVIARIEDQYYWKRKSYISLSFSHFKLVNAARKQQSAPQRGSFIKWIHEIVHKACTGERGYSTIQMQLFRILGLSTGYKYKYRRKMFEMVYAPLYFRSLKKCINYKEKDDIRYKYYLLNIYAHKARCYHNIHVFERNMLELFGLHPNDRLTNLSLEQVLVATYAFSNKIELIREETVDSILEHFQLTALDRNKVLQACKQAKKPKRTNEELAALK